MWFQSSSLVSSVLLAELRVGLSSTPTFFIPLTTVNVVGATLKTKKEDVKVIRRKPTLVLSEEDKTTLVLSEEDKTTLVLSEEDKTTLVLGVVLGCYFDLCKAHSSSVNW